MSIDSRRVHVNGRKAADCQPPSGEEASISSSGQYSTTDLNELLLDALFGVQDDAVSLAKASTMAYVSGKILKAVELECRYGSKQKRRSPLRII